MDSYQPVNINSPTATNRLFDQIPNELLALILIWTSILINDKDRQFTFPLVIPQLVSNRWKEVVCTTPNLWTVVRVDKRLPSEILKNYLERSGGMSLSLDIMSFEFLPIIAPHAARLGQVTAWVGSQSDIDDIIEKVLSLATSLRHFSGIISSRSNELIPLPSIGLLSSSLQSLHLTYLFLGWGPYPLSLNNLTELVLRLLGIPREVVDIQGLLALLESMSKLKRLTIDAIMLHDEELKDWLRQRRQFRATELPLLEELVLLNCYITEFLFLTSHISCPNIQLLGVGLLEMFEDTSDQETWNTFSPKYPHLKRLDLWSFPEDPYHLLLAVLNLPPIITLGICRGYYALNIGHCLESLGHFRDSVEILQTRNIDMASLRGLVRDWFPRTRKIYKYWGDADTLDGVAEHFPELPDIAQWGRMDGDVWYLESHDEQEERVEGVYDMGTLHNA